MLKVRIQFQFVIQARLGWITALALWLAKP
jgi:hypothetical protein